MTQDAAARAAGTASLADWLIKRGKLTGYQASLLLEGKPGPFVFGDYKVVDRVNQGRLNHWFKAKDPQGEDVLLVFASQLALSEADVAEQTAAAMSIRSPHVSGVRAFVEGQANSVIVVEGLNGQSLRERLAAGKLDRDTATKIVFQLSMALAAMHGQNRAHGKICPDNIWIEPSGSVKLLQFPFVSVATIEQLTKPPMVDYLAPDVIGSRVPASLLTDVYSLGCTAFELIAGQVPFPEGNARQKMLRHQQERPRRLDKLVPGVSEDLADLVSEMIEKEPLMRRQSADLPHLLAPLATNLSLRQASPPQIDPRKLTTGYGAWRAEDFQAPPQTVMPVQRPAPAATPEPAQRPSNTDLRSCLSNADRRRSRQSRLSVQRRRNSRLPNAASRPICWSAPPWRWHWWSCSCWWPHSSAGVARGRTNRRRTPPPRATRHPARRRRRKQRAEEPASAPEEVPSKEIKSEAKSAEKQINPVEKLATPAPRPAPDEERPLWASPTTGEPPVLEYLPSGAQAIVICHPAAILETGEGGPACLTCWAPAAIG